MGLGEAWGREAAGQAWQGENMYTITGYCIPFPNLFSNLGDSGKHTVPAYQHPMGLPVLL